MATTDRAGGEPELGAWVPDPRAGTVGHRLTWTHPDVGTGAGGLIGRFACRARRTLRAADAALRLREAPAGTPRCRRCSGRAEEADG